LKGALSRKGKGDGEALTGGLEWKAGQTESGRS
jgi:hypothetical protein